MMATPILMLAGERSGDLLGAALANALKQRWPERELAGMVGPEMQAAGVTCLVDNDDLDIFGLSGLARNLGKLWRAKRTLKQYVQQHKPIVICIDYPGFNLRFAKLAKRAGCRVLFVVSPQIWAWRPHRGKVIQQVVDHMAVLLPFEKKLYAKLGVPCTQIRHPLLGIVPEPGPKAPSASPCIALCPGSRPSEKDRLLNIFLETAAAVKAAKPDCRFVLIRAKTLRDSDWPTLPNYISTVDEADTNVLQHCQAALVCSGTMTLQLALHNLPMVIAYRMPDFSYHIAKHLVKTPYVGLCNIVAEQKVAPEFLQSNVTAENLSAALLETLAAPEKQITAWSQLRQSLSCAAIESLTDVIADWYEA